MAHLGDMPLISKLNKEIHFLLCVIDIYSKYAWVVPLKDKKGITITNYFQKISKESNNHEAKSKGPNSKKIWVDKENFLIAQFYNR